MQSKFYLGTFSAYLTISELHQQEQSFHCHYGNKGSQTSQKILQHQEQKGQKVMNTLSISNQISSDFRAQNFILISSVDGAEKRQVKKIPGGKKRATKFQSLLYFPSKILGKGHISLQLLGNRSSTTTIVLQPMFLLKLSTY